MASNNVPQLLVTSTTAGAWFEITIPNGVGGFISRKIAFTTLSDAFTFTQSKNKGFYATEAALIAAFPTGENGWYAIVGETDTVWIWDSDGSAWVDSGLSGAVTSVNGLTGEVELNAEDIPYSGLAGLLSNNVRDAIDELSGMIGGDAGMPKIIYDPTDVGDDCFDSANHAYDNTDSGLEAEKVKDAIDELSGRAVFYEFDSGALQAGVLETVEHGQNLSNYFINVRSLTGDNNAMVQALHPDVIDPENKINIKVPFAVDAPGLKIQIMGVR